MIVGSRWRGNLGEESVAVYHKRGIHSFKFKSISLQSMQQVVRASVVMISTRIKPRGRSPGLRLKEDAPGLELARPVMARYRSPTRSSAPASPARKGLLTTAHVSANQTTPVPHSTNGRAVGDWFPAAPRMLGCCRCMVGMPSPWKLPAPTRRAVVSQRGFLP